MALDGTLPFRVVRVGNCGGCGCLEDGGRALCVAGMGLQARVGDWEGTGRRIRGGGAGTCAF